jgi:hypothetical protein
MCTNLSHNTDLAQERNVTLNAIANPKQDHWLSFGTGAGVVVDGRPLFKRFAPKHERDGNAFDLNRNRIRHEANNDALLTVQVLKRCASLGDLDAITYRKTPPQTIV